MKTINGYRVGCINKKDCIGYLTYWINLRDRRLLERGATAKELIIEEQSEHLRFMLARIKGEPTDRWVVKSPESFEAYIEDWVSSLNHEMCSAGTQQGAIFEKIVFLNKSLNFTFPEIAKEMLFVSCNCLK